MTRIAIVDQDRGVRDSVTDYLTMVGYEVFAFGAAHEVLFYLESSPIDVVITEVPLNHTDGFQLTETIRQSHDTDVMILTGFSTGHIYEKAISKGASDILFKPVRYEELHLRVKRVLHQRKLTAEHNEMMERLRHMAITDPLTRLYNQGHFPVQLKKEIDRFNRNSQPLTLMILDIDNFKKFNDTYGHLEGDRALINLGRVVKESLRTMDMGFRFGGEEFAAVLPETTMSEGLVVAERIQKTLKSTPVTSKHLQESVFTTVSIGITEYIHGESRDDFVRRADKAMYLSKEKGKDRISILDNSDP